jgi:hypothetical protein
MKTIFATPRVLNVPMARVQRDILGHELVRVEKQGFVAQTSCLLFGMPQEQTPNPMTLPVRTNRYVLEEDAFRSGPQSPIRLARYKNRSEAVSSLRSSLPVVVVASRTIERPGNQAAVLETTSAIRTGTGHCVPAFRISTFSAWTTRYPRLTRASDGNPRRRLLVNSKAPFVRLLDLAHGTPPNKHSPVSAGRGLYTAARDDAERSQ